MIMKSVSMFLVAASLSTAFAVPSANASCDDRPGTPDDVRAYAVSPTSICFGWRNTTGRASGGAFDYYFDISVRDGGGQPVGLDRTGFGPFKVAYGSHSASEFTGLASSSKYCFSIRARTEGGTEGCVSEISSATVCATTLGPPHAPVSADTCISGYVWRNVTSTDHVCVEPTIRDKVRADNLLAKDRTVPSTRPEQVCLPGVRCQQDDLPCKPGFVWRVAVPGDYVCVEPATRQQAQIDNSKVAERRVGSAPPPSPPPPCAPQSAAVPTTRPPQGESCDISVTIQNKSCINVDGTPSTILNPGTTSGLGCGSTEENALTRAKQSYQQFGCITDGEQASPGCCTYSKQAVQGCLCPR
jgi:hypothetical protein